MKVLYIANTTVMADGSTKSLISMIRQAQAKGIEFAVVCPGEDGLAEWLRQRGIKVYVTRFQSVYGPSCKSLGDIAKWTPRFLYYSSINIAGRAAVKRIAKEYAPEIIHENSSTIDVGYHAALSIGVPYVMHIREFGSIDFNMTVPGRKRRLKGTNVFSIPITKALRSHLGLDTDSRASQIYDGIVTEGDFRFDEDKKKWFLYAGRIEEAKGIGDLLDAYADYIHAATNPMPLRICGGCPNPAYLEKIKVSAKQKGIDEYLEWCGDREDIADFMSQAAATIMPSRCEGLGRVMPEAMANGCLCVVRNISGTKEQLENGERFTGGPIAIAYEDVTQLTDALLRITDSIEKGNAFAEGSEYRRIIDRSQAAVREFFTEESFGEKIYGFYDAILNTKGKDN